MQKRTLLTGAGGLAVCTLLAGAVLFGSDTLQASSDDPLPHRTDLSEADRARVAAVLNPPESYTSAQGFEAMSGGAATHTGAADGNAFSRFSANLAFDQQADFNIGDSLFSKLWVSSPSSTQASDGLGPLFNARSCQSCHLKDGRGHTPVDENDSAISMFLRLSVPPRTDAEFAALEDRTLLRIAEPTYGGQFQDLAVPGLQAEGRMVIAYTEEPVELADGEIVALRRPTYSVSNLGYGPMDPAVMLSPRIAPPMIGLGLIEAIHPGDILALADAVDTDGDEISGRPSWVINNATGELALGLFGWKGSNPTVRQQSSSAFSGDIGISTPDALAAHGDCTINQPDCLAMPTGVQDRLGDSEAPDPVLDLVTFYASNLAVPMRRDVDDPEVLLGKQLFADLGCASCHQPNYVTRRDASIEAHQFQLIWPYSDFLLHDMGEGLADNRPVGDASGTEWKTPPLWGIGLTQTVNGHTQFLHDGRARSLLEAVLWHGGEAQDARDSVVALDTDDRNALIAFLESL